MTSHPHPGAMVETGGSLRESTWGRIAAELTDSIRRGLYSPGERLPSEHALAELFGVNRHTIRRSLASLCQSGLLRASQGSGTYVEEFAVELAIGRRTRHRQSLMQAGLRGGLRVLDAQAARATQDEARALKLRAGSRVLHLHVLGEGEGQPLHVSDRWFPLPRFAGFDEHVQATGSITQAFAACGVADYTRSESRVSAQLPSSEIAALLKQPVNRPVLRVTSVNVDPDGIPIEFASTWFAGDRVTLTIQHEEH